MGKIDWSLVEFFNPLNRRMPPSAAVPVDSRLLQDAGCNIVSRRGPVSPCSGSPGVGDALDDGGPMICLWRNASAAPMTPCPLFELVHRDKREACLDLATAWGCALEAMTLASDTVPFFLGTGFEESLSRSRVLPAWRLRTYREQAVPCRILLAGILVSLHFCPSCARGGLWWLASRGGQGQFF